MVRSGRCRLRPTAATGVHHAHRSRYRMLPAARQRRRRKRRRTPPSLKQRRRSNRLQRRNQPSRRHRRHHPQSAWQNLRCRSCRRRKCRRRRGWISTLRRSERRSTGRREDLPGRYASVRARRFRRTPDRRYRTRPRLLSSGRRLPQGRKRTWSSCCLAVHRRKPGPRT